MTNTEAFYEEQYRKIQEGTLYLILFSDVEAETHAGKHEALREVLLRNTLMLSEISVASKYLTIAMEKGSQIEISYFKKLLAFHCYDLLYPHEGGVSQLVMILINRFRFDLVKPKKLLLTLFRKRSEILKINREHFFYFKRIKHRVVLTKRKGDGLQQFQVIDTINAGEVLSISTGFIETFIELNLLLVELLQHLGSNSNMFSGDNCLI